MGALTECGARLSLRCTDWSSAVELAAATDPEEAETPAQGRKPPKRSADSSTDTTPKKRGTKVGRRWPWEAVSLGEAGLSRCNLRSTKVNLAELDGPKKKKGGRRPATECGSCGSWDRSCGLGGVVAGRLRRGLEKKPVLWLVRHGAFCGPNAGGGQQKEAFRSSRQDTAVSNNATELAPKTSKRLVLSNPL